MSPEAAEVGEWLSKAATDLRTAEKALAEPDPIPASAVFHCQQAVEKALKAYLTWREKAFGKTHNLADLGAACVAFDPGLADLVAQVAPLTQFAWRYRYPGAPLGPTVEEARETIAVARSAVVAIIERLPEDFKPHHA